MITRLPPRFWLLQSPLRITRAQPCSELLYTLSLHQYARRYSSLGKSEREIAGNVENQPPRKRKFHFYAWGICFLLGLALGAPVREVMAPKPPLVRGTKEDQQWVQTITKMGENLSLVKSLSQDPNWTSWDAYSSSTPEAREHRLTTSTLGSSSTIGGFQHVFHNKQSGEFISVVHIGNASWGWPLVVHGGLLATLLDESIGRCAIKHLRDHSGVTANLKLDYRKPVLVTSIASFYVIKVKPEEEGATETKRWATGTIEDLNGKVFVEASGMYVVPKGFKTKPLGDTF